MGLQKCMRNACSFQRAKSLLNSPRETPCLMYSQEGQGVLEGHTPGLICCPEEGDKDGGRVWCWRNTLDRNTTVHWGDDGGKQLRRHLDDRHSLELCLLWGGWFVGCFFFLQPYFQLCNGVCNLWLSSVRCACSKAQ